MTGYQAISPNNGHQGDMPYCTREFCFCSPRWQQTDGGMCDWQDAKAHMQSSENMRKLKLHWLTWSLAEAGINPMIAWSFKRNINMCICTLDHSSMLKWHRQLKSSLMEDKLVLHIDSQYHVWWFPGNTESQGISSNGIDLVSPE